MDGITHFINSRPHTQTVKPQSYILFRITFALNIQKNIHLLRASSAQRKQARNTNQPANGREDDASPQSLMTVMTDWQTLRGGGGGNPSSIILLCGRDRGNIIFWEGGLYPGKSRQGGRVSSRGPAGLRMDEGILAVNSREPYLV